MELVLLVYLVENLSYNGTFFGLWSGVVLFIVFILTLVRIVFTVGDDDLPFKIPFKTLIAIIFIFTTLHTFLPERQTMIYMVGAYAAQEVLTSEKTKELGDKTYKVLSHQLDKWVEEVPELKDIVTDNVVSVVKDKVSEELTK